jgi:hypothetical protein
MIGIRDPRQPVFLHPPVPIDSHIPSQEDRLSRLQASLRHIRRTARLSTSTRKIGLVAVWRVGSAGSSSSGPQITVAPDTLRGRSPSRGRADRTSRPPLVRRRCSCPDDDPELPRSASRTKPTRSPRGTRSARPGHASRWGDRVPSSTVLGPARRPISVRAHAHARASASASPPSDGQPRPHPDLRPDSVRQPICAGVWIPHPTARRVDRSRSPPETLVCSAYARRRRQAPREWQGAR